MSLTNFKPCVAGITALFAFSVGTLATRAEAAPLPLGEAFGFAVLSASAVTNTGASFVQGHVGVSPAGSITGFAGATQASGTMQSNTALAAQAQADLEAAYNTLTGETATQNLSGQDLGTQTLAPGVYRFDTSAQLTGALVLDARNNPDARFDFQIGSTLTTATAATVLLINGATPDNVFWQVGSSATIATNTVFQGNLLALTSITLMNGASNLNGRALARNGAVTLDTNRIGVVVPEPSAGLLAGLAVLPMVLVRLLHRRKISKAG